LIDGAHLCLSAILIHKRFAGFNRALKQKVALPGDWPHTAMLELDMGNTF
jgi:hypothetical protein